MVPFLVFDLSEYVTLITVIKITLRNTSCRILLAWNFSQFEVTNFENNIYKILKNACHG